MLSENYGISVITPPALEPITVAELKVQLRIDTSVTAEDSALTAWIESARILAENFTNRTFINTTLEYYQDRFPCYRYIELPRPPSSSITYVKYIDTTGTETTLSSALYTLDTSHTRGRVTLNYDEVWPDTRLQPNAVKVRYVAGYGSAASSVPAPLKQAILIKAAMMYYDREGLQDQTDNEKAFERLLNPFRIMGV